mmetsp:Transcript_42258/g.111756  ORF Transcript_42258/g.111756 Transcript_42258/m.111756 type:complete len:266 (+) Transcript_42258:191-988(+)
MARADGYWGPTTSTIDWCEENYLVTGYVAEFSNSTTSMFITMAGLLPLVLHRDLWPLLEWRFLLAFLCIIVVGLGSVAFHGTLLFEHQMWDEVPMLWTVVVLVYVLLEHHQKEPRYGPGLPAALAAYAAFATYATSQQGGNWQWFSFHALFGACELPCLYLVYRFFQGLDPGQADLRRLLKKGLFCYVFAIGVWLSDLNFCARLQQLPGYSYWNLHAFGWHSLTACGLYSMLLGIWYHRLRNVLGVKVTLASGLVPRLLAEKVAP